MSKNRRKRLADKATKGNAVIMLVTLLVIIILVTLLVERITLELSLSGLALALVLAIGFYCCLIRNDT